MTRRPASWLGPALLVAGLAFAGGPAAAACHAFGLEVSPTSVTEGASVTVTVTRDGAVGPSQVDVSTVDGTAKAGSDYTRLQRTVMFTNDTRQTFTVGTTDDDADEPAETFRVHLSDPGGCAVNPNFQLDPDVTVTIRDNDAAPAGSPTKAGAPPASDTPSASPSPSPSDSPSPASTSPASPTGSPSPRATASGIAAGDDGAGGLSGSVVAGIVAAAMAIGALTLLLARRRAS